MNRSVVLMTLSNLEWWDAMSQIFVKGHYEYRYERNYAHTEPTTGWFSMSIITHPINEVLCLSCAILPIKTLMYGRYVCV